MRPPREDTEPWYKQFWPWFLIALPASVVVASIVTINLAIESDDGLVSDDYYKEGLAIHKDADSAARAQALEIAGTLNYDADTGAINLVLDKPLQAKQPALSLEVVHPTLPDQDQTIRLSAVDGIRFAGRLKVASDLVDSGRVTDTGIQLDPVARHEICRRAVNHPGLNSGGRRCDRHDRCKHQG